MSGLASWLLAARRARGRDIPVGALGPRPVIAVFGLSRGCGATVVARALAAELAARDSAGAAAVSCAARGSAVSLATHAATRLARSLADVPGAATRAVGRLCLVGGADELALADCARHFAPLVLDAGSGALGGRRRRARRRDAVWWRPRPSEPALAAVAAACLARVGPEPVVVVNGGGHGAWRDRAAVTLPRSRMGAQLALGGGSRAASSAARWSASPISCSSGLVWEGDGECSSFST